MVWIRNKAGVPDALLAHSRVRLNRPSARPADRGDAFFDDAENDVLFDRLVVPHRVQRRRDSRSAEAKPNPKQAIALVMGVAKGVEASQQAHYHEGNARDRNKIRTGMFGAPHVALRRRKVAQVAKAVVVI